MLNYTRNPRRRFKFDMGIGVNEDLVLAQQIGIDVLRTLDGVMDNPPPRAFIAARGDSNVQVRYYGWVDHVRTIFRWKSEAIRRVKAAPFKATLNKPISTEAVDTRVNTELQVQLAHDERLLDAQNLLDPAAPKE